MLRRDNSTNRSNTNTLVAIALLVLVSLCGLSGIYLLITDKGPQPGKPPQANITPTTGAIQNTPTTYIPAQSTATTPPAALATMTPVAISHASDTPGPVAVSTIATAVVPTPVVFTPVPQAPSATATEVATLVAPVPAGAYNPRATPSPYTNFSPAKNAGNPAAIYTPVAVVGNAPSTNFVLPNGVHYGEHMPQLPGRIARIASPSIHLDTSVYEIYGIDGTWEVAQYAAGHHYNAANPGEGGNIVVSGHNNWKGEVFRYLDQLKPGDEIDVWTLNGKEYKYQVENILTLKEVGISVQQRLANASVLKPTSTEQLTLITCWPYTTFTHRLVVIAKPVK